MKIRLATLIVFWAFFLPLFSQSAIKETVVVTANADPVPFENLSRTVTILTREQLAALPITSIADLIDYAASIDIQSRAPFGVQADFSLRGAGYGQTLVLVNGMRINDSQTGHHNGDIPLVLADIERVEILYGPGSSIYGADALGGTINIITQRQELRREATFSIGAHGFVDGSASFAFRHREVTQRLSFGANRSDGFMFDRDFNTLSFTSQTAFASESNLLVSHLRREFGANQFYGPSPSKEWTDTTLVQFEQALLTTGRMRLTANAHYRTHGDHFLWDVRRPGFFENRHRTHAVGGLAKAQITLSDASKVTFGGDFGGDWITSNNLGDHAFARGSLFVELQQKLGQRAVLSPGFRFDHYSHFGSSANPAISGSWWIHPTVKIRSSLGHAFRAPTFTERFYRDPNHQANAALKPQTSWGADAGLDWMPTPYWLVKAGLFARWEDNVIDWVRPSADRKWETHNIRELKTRGIELGVQRWATSGTLVQLDYTYLLSKPDTHGGLSKYVLDFARHSFRAAGTLKMPWGFSYGQGADYRYRIDGRRYWVLDGRLTKAVGDMRFFVELSNMLATRYQEIRGVDMPGRWLRLGVRFVRF